MLPNPEFEPPDLGWCKPFLLVNRLPQASHCCNAKLGWHIFITWQDDVRRETILSEEKNLLWWFQIRYCNRAFLKTRWFEHNIKEEKFVVMLDFPKTLLKMFSSLQTMYLRKTGFSSLPSHSDLWPDWTEDKVQEASCLLQDNLKRISYFLLLMFGDW